MAGGHELATIRVRASSSGVPSSVSTHLAVAEFNLASAAIALARGRVLTQGSGVWLAKAAVRSQPPLAVAHGLRPQP